jgi:hypothetical protein
LDYIIKKKGKSEVYTHAVLKRDKEINPDKVNDIVTLVKWLYHSTLTI